MLSQEVRGRGGGEGGGREREERRGEGKGTREERGREREGREGGGCISSGRLRFMSLSCSCGVTSLDGRGRGGSKRMGGRKEESDRGKRKGRE